MSEKYEVLEEQKFPYFNMSREERNCYLNILRHCKDICNTENKVGNISRCEILKLTLNKENNVIFFEGFLTIGPKDKQESRCINGELYVDNNSVMVYMSVTRIGALSEPSEYRVSDEFKIKNDVLKRKSLYSYRRKSKIDEVNDETMKGLLK